MKRKILQFEDGYLKEADKEIGSEQQLKTKKRNTTKIIVMVSGIGFQIAIPLIIGVVLGKYIDTKVSTYPKYTLMLLGVGFFVSISALVHIIRLLDKE